MGALDDLHGQETAIRRHGCARVRRKPEITQPFEDDVAFSAYRRATCATETPGAVVCWQIDRFSSTVQSRFVRRAIGRPIVSAIHGGHYPTLQSPQQGGDPGRLRCIARRTASVVRALP